MYTSDPEFAKCRTKDELCKILDFAQIKLNDFIHLVNNLTAVHDKSSILEILRHVTIDYSDFDDDEYDKVSKSLEIISSSLDIKLISDLSHIIQHKNKEKSIHTQDDKENQIPHKKLQLKYAERKLNTKNQINKLTNIGLTSENFNEIYDILNSCALNNDTQTIKYAIQNDFMSIQNDNLDNILTFAASENNFNLAKMLVDAGADYTYDRDCGQNCLFWFTKNGNFDAVVFFASLGMDINSPNVFGLTTLMLCCKYDYYDVCQYLLTFPTIKIDAVTQSGQTALKLCKSNKMKELIMKNLK